jgi:pullulanase/glycogen debranching enzyme
MKTRPGAPYPLGATWDGAGVNFALFSENATGVELCLFDGAEGNEERAPLSRRSSGQPVCGELLIFSTQISNSPHTGYVHVFVYAKEPFKIATFLTSQ